MIFFKKHSDLVYCYGICVTNDHGYVTLTRVCFTIVCDLSELVARVCFTIVCDRSELVARVCFTIVCGRSELVARVSREALAATVQVTLQSPVYSIVKMNLFCCDMHAFLSYLIHHDFF
jgi:hypothetical protein